MIVLDICLSDIPKEQIVRAKNGKSYCKLVVAERKEEDRFGQNLMVYMSASKEDRGKPRQFVGSGKSYTFPNSNVSSNAVRSENDGTDDLPF